MRVVFAGGGTGGHLYPGLAIARALVRLAPAVEPFFVGALRGIERTVLPQTEFPHLLLDLHPLYRSAPFRNWRTVRGLASSWRRIGALARAERPRVVVGTGGYASGAMNAWAITHGIPTAQMVMDSHPGLAARLFTRWSREVYLGYPEAAQILRGGRHTEMVDTGNPIEPPPSPLPDRAAARREWGFPSEGGAVLLVFGGSQGARALNDAMAGWVEHGLPDPLHVIWATGVSHFDRFARFEDERVRVRPYLAPIARAYAASDLALTRAGAMTTAELCAWGIPTVLVPLPTAAADHQSANALSLERAGAAIHLPQRELDASRLATLVGELLHEPARLGALAAAARARGRPEAAETIARRVLNLAQLNDLRS